MLKPSERIYEYVVPVGIDYRVPVSIDIYVYAGPVGIKYRVPVSMDIKHSKCTHVYVGPVGIEYRIPVSIDIIKLKNGSCICGAGGHRTQSPSQHRC